MKLMKTKVKETKTKNHDRLKTQESSTLPLERKMI